MSNRPKVLVKPHWQGGATSGLCRRASGLLRLSAGPASGRVSARCCRDSARRTTCLRALGRPDASETRSEVLRNCGRMPRTSDVRVPSEAPGNRKAPPPEPCKQPSGCRECDGREALCEVHGFLSPHASLSAGARWVAIGRVDE